MASDPTILDISKFNLDAFEATAEVEMKMMKTYADFNFRMMQVAELQMKVATDQVKLVILRESLESYRLAQLEAKRQVRDRQQKVERYSVAIRSLNHLLAGETVSPAFVPIGWRGFRLLTSQAQAATALELARVPCEAADRLGSGFFDAFRPYAEVPAAPPSINRALGLMDWARRANFVPRLGSGAQNRLGDLLAVLGSGATATLGRYETQLKEAEKELTRIREISWANLNLLEEKPKK